jgi:hypothetical protein
MLAAVETIALRLRRFNDGREFEGLLSQVGPRPISHSILRLVYQGEPTLSPRDLRFS